MENVAEMSVRTLRVLACTALGAGAIALSACQGNIGGGSGLSIPQAPGYNQPAGPGGAQSSSRERVLEGAVYLSSKLTEVPLPQLAGFSVALELGTPGPIPSPSSSPSAGASSGKPGAALKHAAGAAAVVAAVASTVPAPSATPAPLTSGASAAPVPSGSASAAASGAPAGSPSPKASHSPNPSTATAGPRIETKTTVYPDDAPAAPTPIPTGEVQVFIKRVPIIRGYVLPQTDISLFGLGAVRFTVPTTEIAPKRGFTIAIYQEAKHHKDRLIAYDTDAPASGSVLASSLSDPIVLKKNAGYLPMLYGDDLGAPPAQVAPGYPQPGNNPFPAPTGSGNPPNSYGQPAPCQPQQPGYPQPQQPYQNCSPTPYSPFGTPHP
jgi:hypothetical protein